MKKKAKINFIIDVLLFVMMAAIGGIGLLIKYSLISGKDQWEVYGSNVELTLWGWDRHQWGSLHLILGFILFGLLLLHLLFHWKQIKGLFRHLIPLNTSRIILTGVFIAITLALLIFGLIIPRDVVFLKMGEGHHRDQRVERNDALILEKSVKQIEESSSPDTRDISHHEENHHNRNSSIDVNGSMSLKQAADAYGISPDSLKAFLKIPIGQSNDERLGRLRRKYNFHMSDIERYAEEFHKDIK